MAIINCPSCGKKVSNVTSMCPYCGFKRGEVSEEEVLEFRRRKLRDHVYHLKMISYVVITVFLAGFGWYWFDTGGFQHPSSMGPLVAVSLSSVGYVFIRGLLFRARRQMKQIRA